MSYKNDSLLVIANKFGSASGDAKCQLYETYDRLRDLTVSGSVGAGTGFESAGGFLYQLASLFAPSAFMTTMGGTSSMNIPGTSYWTPSSSGSTSSFGVATGLALSVGFTGFLGIFIFPSFIDFTTCPFASNETALTNSIINILRIILSFIVPKVSKTNTYSHPQAVTLTSINKTPKTKQIIWIPPATQ